MSAFLDVGKWKVESRLVVTRSYSCCAKKPHKLSKSLKIVNSSIVKLCCTFKSPFAPGLSRTHGRYPLPFPVSELYTGKSSFFHSKIPPYRFCILVNPASFFSFMPIVSERTPSEQYTTIFSFLF